MYAYAADDTLTCALLTYGDRKGLCLVSVGLPLRPKAYLVLPECYLQAHQNKITQTQKTVALLYRWSHILSEAKPQSRGQSRD